jgi:hypothetical protein
MPRRMRGRFPQEAHMKKLDTPQLAKIAATPNLPDIFRIILQSHDVFVDGEEIVDLVFVERDGCEIVGTNIEKYVNWQPATLVIVTTYGLTILTEGGFKISESFYGYTIRHLVFSKISSISLDICMLEGKLSIATAMNSNPETLISFNTSVYFKEFERLIGIIRKQMFKVSGK